MFPDPRLRAVAAPVAQVDDQVRAIWDEMLQAMYEMPGLGLAAPQLGIGLRLAVLDCSDTRDQPVRLANPELVQLSEEMQTLEEGSPNIPGLFDNVTRPSWAKVRFLGPDGPEERRFDGLWATSLQHQIDHLNGKMFVDRLPALRRRRILEKHRKAQAKRGRSS